MQALFARGSDAFLMGGRPIPLRLGQVSWGTPVPGPTAPTTAPPGTKCYRCGFQGNRVMTPAMAAMVPGGCVEIPMTECGFTAPATTTAPAPTTGTTTQPAPSAPTAPPPCDTATDLVCAVKAAQALWTQVYNGQINAWGSSPQSQSLAADNARYAVENSFKHPALKKNWSIYGSWIGDSQIKPEEWPELIKNFEQMWGIWAAVPWPRAQLKDLFERCAKGVKLHQDMTVFSPRLYVNRFSNFWPKTDEEIRRVIATVSLQNIPGIYLCMQHKIEKKIQNEERKMKKWSIIGQAAGMLFTGNIVASAIFNAASQLTTFNNALDFSKFMMSYQEFVEECRTAEAEDFTCAYLAPFIIWCMEVLFMAQFFDYVAADAGLPGAEAGLTQNQVIEPMVEDLKEQGIEVPKAVYTPGGVAPAPNLLPVIGGVGFVGLLALIGSSLIK
jgi:hypothetical protein